MRLRLVPTLVLLLAAPFSRAGAAPQPFDQTPYTHSQTLVTIAPGRRLNLYCTGHGSPAVIFDYGWGGPSYAWANVQPEVSKFTEACSYDRAGQGFSDPGPLPRDTDALVTDLHALLHKAGLKPPYIYVGHSLAGLNGALFADRYLPELAGMVLVDPSFAHQGELFARALGSDGTSARHGLDFTPCEKAAAAQSLPTDPKLVDLCLDHDPKFSQALMAATDRMALRPSYWTDLESEGDSFNAQNNPGHPDIDSPELDKAFRDWGNLDLIVLTSGHRVKSPGLTPAQADTMFSVWNTGHDALASRSRNGKNELVPDAGHYIQWDKPESVVAAIRNVVDRVKKK